MKKLFITLLLITLPILAQNIGGFGIGIGASSTIGINAEVWILDNYAVSVFASYHADNSNLKTVTIHTDVHFQPILASGYHRGFLRSPLYLGLGLKAKPVHEANERYLWNLRFILGLCITPPDENSGWDISFECVPTLEVSPITSLYINGMAIFRVWF